MACRPPGAWADHDDAVIARDDGEMYVTTIRRIFSVCQSRPFDVIIGNDKEVACGSKRLSVSRLRTCARYGSCPSRSSVRPWAATWTNPGVVRPSTRPSEAA